MSSGLESLSTMEKDIAQEYVHIQKAKNIEKKHEFCNDVRTHRSNSTIIFHRSPAWCTAFSGDRLRTWDSEGLWMLESVSWHKTAWLSWESQQRAQIYVHALLQLFISSEKTPRSAPHIPPAIRCSLAWPGLGCISAGWGTGLYSVLWQRRGCSSPLGTLVIVSLFWFWYTIGFSGSLCGLRVSHTPLTRFIRHELMSVWLHKSYTTAL